MPRNSANSDSRRDLLPIMDLENQAIVLVEIFDLFGIFERIPRYYMTEEYSL